MKNIYETMIQQVPQMLCVAVRDIAPQSHWSLIYLLVLSDINNEMESVIEGFLNYEKAVSQQSNGTVTWTVIIIYEGWRNNST